MSRVSELRRRARETSGAPKDAKPAINEAMCPRADGDGEEQDNSWKPAKRSKDNIDSMVFFREDCFSKLTKKERTKSHQTFDAWLTDTIEKYTKKEMDDIEVL